MGWTQAAAVDASLPRPASTHPIWPGPTLIIPHEATSLIMISPAYPLCCVSYFLKFSKKKTCVSSFFLLAQLPGFGLVMTSLLMLLLIMITYGVLRSKELLQVSS